MQGRGRVMLMKRKEVVLAVLLWLLASCLRHWPDRAELKTSWKSSAVTAMETSTSIPCCTHLRCPFLQPAHPIGAAGGVPPNNNVRIIM